MAVLYGPNEVGKTSLVKVLRGEKETSTAFSCQGTSYPDPTTVFYVVNDQVMEISFLAETSQG